MEQKDIDIYEILKKEEYGTELYTPICGKVWHSGMANDKDSAKAIWTEDEAGKEHFFDKNGKVSKEGEILLFPSNEMRDWSKFFKYGDILVNEDGDAHIIFKGFDDYTYKTFKGNYYLLENEGSTVTFGEYEDNLPTSEFNKANKEDAQEYIHKIEKELGGKLNLETLKIEKSEFKDGDIVALVVRKCTHIAIFQSRQEAYIGFHAVLCQNDELLLEEPFREDVGDIELRLATEEEKRQLFSALEKEGKAWDAEKRQVVGLKPAKPTFEIGKLYVFNEDDEDGELTIIGKLIDKNEREDTLTFGYQYEIENEKFVTDQTFDLRISVSKELREATELEVEIFNKHFALWEKEARKQPAFKTFDKVLVRNRGDQKWLPAFFVRDRGEETGWRYNVLPIHSGKSADFTSCIPYEGHENFAFTDYDFVDLPF